MGQAGSLLLEEKIADAAFELGFDVCKITPAKLPKQIETDLKNYLAQGHHGSMGWMDETFSRRVSPSALWNEAKSAIVLAMNYGPETNPLADLGKYHSGIISTFARNRDYHAIIKGKLKILAGKLVSWRECDVKVFVDTAPVMEKPLAAQAGIGWQGKHTNLVSREYGSWLFLGSILTTANLKPSEDDCNANHCGNCTLCLEICPTRAFIQPHQIDARRCISYLTIENKGPIPVEFRTMLGNRIFGCDDCLAICPWNKFAQSGREQKLQARQDLKSPELEFLAQLDDQNFRKFFSGSPVKRIGRDRFLRNVLIAIGNSGDDKFFDLIYRHLTDQNEIVRGAAIWALRMVLDEDKVAVIREQFLALEQIKIVRQEWETELETRSK